uniref:DUF6562 domain-containing protein n=1 Tax=Alistipes sp. TaxID=1872444 RepID=UPI00405608A6
MKKLFYSLAAIAALFATACTTDASSDVQMAGESKVTFSLQAKGLGSRAINDGTKATELTYAIYDGDWDLLDTKELSFSAGSLEMQLTLDLVKNQTYNFVFWAQSENAGCYTLNLPQKGEPSVDVDYSALASNNDDLDAFYGKVLGLEVKGTVNKTVELRRPFAQINFGTDDLERAAQLGFDLANAKVSVTTKTYNKFYLNDGRVDGAMQDVTFTDATPIDTTADAKSLKAGDSNYHWVSMNYILWPDATDLSLSTCEMEIKVEGREPVKIEVPGAPARRNWRTNLVGSLLTDKSNIKVVIKPEFEGEQTNTNGYYIVNGVYHITSSKGLAWLADEVNNGTNNFSGKTVVLDGDIDLDGFTRANAEWTPIGGKGHYFAGIFDGAGYTVKNFNVNQEGHAGLFGNVRGTIKNLTVENVTIVANHYAGAIVGQGYAKIENCHVNNIDITLTTKNDDWGDKAGGIIGQNCEGYLYVKNSSAKNVTIKGYRDLGGIAGMAHSNNEVSGCSVENITIVQDLSVDYEVPAKRNTLGGVVGRVGSPITIKENTEKNVNVGIAANNVSELNSALTASDNVSIILAEGTFNVDNGLGNGNAGELTVAGAGIDKTTINAPANQHGNNQNPGLYGHNKDLVFKNLTFVTTNNGYEGGIGHARSVTFINCKIIGQFYCHSSAPHKFIDCTIDPQTGYLYTYASNCDFEGCTFESSEGKALQVYAEAPGTFNVNIKDCTFKAAKVAYTWPGTLEGGGKPVTAIDINSNGEHIKFNVNVENSTATGYGVGVNSGSDLWNIKGGASYVTLTIDGELKCVAGFGMITEGYYAQGSTYTVLDGQGFLKVATTVLADSSKNVTVELANDINLAGIEWPAVRTNAAFVLDGKGHTISNLTTSAIESNGFYCVGMFTSTRKATTIKNLVVENATVTGNGLGESHGAVLVSTTWSTLNISGVTVKGSTVSNCDRSSVLAVYLYFADAEVDNCKVEGCTVNSIGTAGAILGVNNSHNFTMNGCQVNGTTISSSEGNNKAGLFIGTWQDAGTLTESGNTHTNSKAINAGTETNNEIGRHA